MEITIELSEHDYVLLHKLSTYVDIPVERLVKYWVRKELISHEIAK